MSAQPYHHGDLRRTLLHAAAAHIETDGVESLSLRQLARDAGVSHAAPSRHFRDKQALLDALAEDGFHRLGASLAAAAQGDSRSKAAARAQFEALGRAYVGFAVEHPALLSLMFAMKHAPDARAELIAAGRASMDITMRVVEAAQANGAIGAGDASRIALATFAAFHGVAMLVSGDLLEGVPAGDLVATTSELLWRGLQSE
ncbi:TetR/AcrR family transcriptional regulator [Microbacterium murale]|uniref:AcrR family transcriptional regulator n=1 Tax=Microbacterium murale TaxID=1081040 RepID=A0ABU0PDX9_9MICO|nr:TetR/AcrR family transcriptional regulator [Microbacterium murale]MDQ0644906.1 AcrR family transcriptional regulator [Microbacterium murale]